MKRIKIRYITVTAIMSALATVLMYLEFSLPILPSFLKYDFSDLPAVITSFALGPVYGLLVELIKNLIHLAASQTGGVGELANFIVGALLVFPAGVIYKFKKDKAGAVLGALAGAVLAAAVSFPVNYFITYPFYMNVMHYPLDVIISLYGKIYPFVDSLPKALLCVNVPFTFIKGLINLVITFVVYKKLSPVLKGKDKNLKNENNTNP